MTFKLSTKNFKVDHVWWLTSIIHTQKAKAGRLKVQGQYLTKKEKYKQKNSVQKLLNA